MTTFNAIHTASAVANALLVLAAVVWVGGTSSGIEFENSRSHQWLQKKLDFRLTRAIA